MVKIMEFPTVWLEYGLVFLEGYVGVSKYRGTPKWMVYFMENPMNKWMIWGEKTTPTFGGPPISLARHIKFTDSNDCCVACVADVVLDSQDSDTLTQLFQQFPTMPSMKNIFFMGRSPWNQTQLLMASFLNFQDHGQGVLNHVGPTVLPIEFVPLSHCLIVPA